MLYSTPACHLCEQAELLLLKILPPDRYSLRKIDIVFDDALMQRYGTSIPVLAKTIRNNTANELFWPFDENKILAFLAS